MHLQRRVHGAGFWHAAHAARCRVRAIYVNVPDPPDRAGFAPAVLPQGRILSCR